MSRLLTKLIIDKNNLINHLGILTRYYCELSGNILHIYLFNAINGEMYEEIEVDLSFEKEHLLINQNTVFTIADYLTDDVFIIQMDDKSYNLRKVDFIGKSRITREYKSIFEKFEHYGGVESENYYTGNEDTIYRIVSYTDWEDLGGEGILPGITILAYNMKRDILVKHRLNNIKSHDVIHDKLNDIFLVIGDSKNNGEYKYIKFVGDKFIECTTGYEYIRIDDGKYIREKRDINCKLFVFGSYIGCPTLFYDNGTKYTFCDKDLVINFKNLGGYEALTNYNLKYKDGYIGYHPGLKKSAIINVFDRDCETSIEFITYLNKALLCNGRNLNKSYIYDGRYFYPLDKKLDDVYGKIFITERYINIFEGKYLCVYEKSLYEGELK